MVVNLPGRFAKWVNQPSIVLSRRASHPRRAQQNTWRAPAPPHSAVRVSPSCCNLGKVSTVKAGASSESAECAWVRIWTGSSPLIREAQQQTAQRGAAERSGAERGGADSWRDAHWEAGNGSAFKIKSQNSLTDEFRNSFSRSPICVKSLCFIYLLYLARWSQSVLNVSLLFSCVVIASHLSSERFKLLFWKDLSELLFCFLQTWHWAVTSRAVCSTLALLWKHEGGEDRFEI